jgi:hypothetical protein
MFGELWECFEKSAEEEDLLLKLEVLSRFLENQGKFSEHLMKVPKATSIEISSKPRHFPPQSSIPSGDSTPKPSNFSLFHVCQKFFLHGCLPRKSFGSIYNPTKRECRTEYRDDKSIDIYKSTSHHLHLRRFRFLRAKSSPEIIKKSSQL